MLTVLTLFLATSFAEIVAGSFAGHVTPNELGVWENRQNLDPGGILTLFWNNTSRENNSFTLLLEGLTHGYVGLGLSPDTGTMAGADMVVAWVDVRAAAHVRDYWADQNGSPTLDAIQDWRVLWSRENNTHTSVLLSRATVTGNPSDIPITTGAMRLIYSWSETDPDGAPHYHGKERRGCIELELLSKSEAPQGNARIIICILFPLFTYLRVFNET